MNGSLAGPNPFVGPRPIRQGQRIYGRDAEIHELYNRLQARRIVLLHSPSGAGKSSLVSAGLIPRLRRSNYDVWKPIRVNLDPSGLGVPAGTTNRFLLSVMVSLEDELPPEHRRAPAELAQLDLLEYLEGRPRRKSRQGRRVVLLFDQFEEILTVAPCDVGAKREFFAQLGRALEREKYWALFVMREDYLGALAPYRAHVPTRFANTFRLDLLSLDGAREAAVELASTGGRSFPGVDKLVRDLSVVQVQQPDGTFVAEQGLHVEPVYLQVVGRRLWDKMPADDLSIEAEDVVRHGAVSKSLAGYYSDAVTKSAGGSLALEREIREWVGQRLIVGGIRSQVRQEPRRSAGLHNDVIAQLLDSYLVRSEPRAGSKWFELSHDRLVEPITKDNQAWEQAHLHPMQVQAKQWEEARRMPALLLELDALPGAVKWASEHDELLTEGERDFLEQSRHLRGEEAEARALREQSTVLRSIISAIPHRVFWKDRNSVYLGANAAFTSLAGLPSPDDIVDMSDFDLPWTREESEAYRADDAEVMDSGVAKRNIEETQMTANGEVEHLLTDKVPLYGANGKVNGVLGIALNISERRRLEARVRDLDARVEHQARVQAELADELASIRCLLRGIEPSDWREVLDAVSATVERMEWLLDGPTTRPEHSERQSPSHSR